ncbi:hypothetical protein QQ020_34445 [Fulvivirgaceae bacterium BMA12]|uniref:Uncharacterized protein n=1 Tax=Agaribacillus aureus TaxID=3051825 RepID=A0ABT8LHE2_9BACT|nr:hypothetical protein [Fulvivirgaceae bacterium BMA12]
MPPTVQLFSILCIIYSLFCPFINGYKEHCLTRNQGDNRYASYSSDGSRIIFESNRDGNWEIYAMDKNGLNQTRLTHNDKEDRRPSRHPDGSKIIYESNVGEQVQLLLLDLKTLKTREIPLPEWVTDPLFAKYSPKAEFIAFSAQDSIQQYHIYLLDQTTLEIQSVVSSAYKIHYPNWSPDGRELVIFSRMDTKNADDEIYKYHLGRQQLTRLTFWPKHNFCPAWSMDGKKIAYVTSMEETRPEIYMMDASGKNQQRLTHNEAGDTLPCWAPDGHSLLFTGYRQGNFQICQIKLAP